MISKTDCRECLFYNGEFCKLPFFSNHKTNLWDHCINFKPKKRKRHPDAKTLEEKDAMFQHLKKPGSLETRISKRD